MNVMTCDYNGRPICCGQKELIRLMRQHAINSCRAPLLASSVALISLVNPATLWAADDSAADLQEVVVTSKRRAQTVIGHAGNVDRLSLDQLTSIRHQHLHELMNRVTGVWLSRGSGQENLTAIRSPVLTGPGSCGSFLTLEDGIPTRPAGFCNVNQFFEINSEQAAAVEIIRGPGNALFGSNALHGIVNVIMPAAGDPSGNDIAIEGGANDYYRFRAKLPLSGDLPLHASLLATYDGGFRDDSGYRQLKGHFKYRDTFLSGDLTSALSFSDLNQETAGFIIGQDAYKDPALNTSNPNPEAFRNADSQRLYAIWTRTYDGVDVDVRPYLRHSRMRFLQHFLPGQPLEENGHVSGGAIVSFTFDTDPVSIVTGADFEWSDVYLRQTQADETQGSDFLRETRPVGKHYDYEVQSIGIAPFVQADFPIGERLTASAGLRAEYMHYEYDNRMLDGNTRDDGTPCGFGGCLYTRPADRSDEFFNVAPSIGLSYRLRPDTSIYASFARGFRAPQMTELYRLQSGQQVADLDSEIIDSLELGIRLYRTRWTADASIYTARKRDSVFRDADGFNVNGARSRHDGIELSYDGQLAERWRLAIAATYAKHIYDFDRVAARGETFVAGRDIDTAPRWLASAELFFAATDAINLSLQWTTIGAYYLDAENLREYPGHDLFNLRAAFEPAPGFLLSFRLNNIADADIADRADFAFGQYRYLPGRGRELFVEFAYSQ